MLRCHPLSFSTVWVAVTLQTGSQLHAATYLPQTRKKTDVSHWKKVAVTLKVSFINIWQGNLTQGVNVTVWGFSICDSRSCCRSCLGNMKEPKAVRGRRAPSSPARNRLGMNCRCTVLNSSADRWTGLLAALEMHLEHWEQVRLPLNSCCLSGPLCCCRGKCCYPVLAGAEQHQYKARSLTHLPD